MESIHKGHRSRLKERFRREGLDGFDEIQVLELLLFYAIPQKDTNPLAHALLNRFGSLDQVLDASVEDLEKVDASQIRVVADLSDVTSIGSCTIQAEVYLNAAKTVGVIGDYHIAVKIS